MPQFKLEMATVHLHCVDETSVVSSSRLMVTSAVALRMYRTPNVTHQSAITETHDVSHNSTHTHLSSTVNAFQQ